MTKFSPDERDAIDRARLLATETNCTVTVWHDCAALEPFISLGTEPPRDRAVQRVLTVYPD